MDSKPKLNDLRFLDYQELDRRMSALASPLLVELLSTKWSKVGDTAAHLLARRGHHSLVSKALLEGTICSAKGRIRALFVLGQFGRACVDASRVYSHLLDDRSDNVVGDALFGLVFLRDKSAIEVIDRYLAKEAKDSKRHELLSRARMALEADDPQIYSPGFWDDKGVWAPARDSR